MLGYLRLTLANLIKVYCRSQKYSLVPDYHNVLYCAVIFFPSLILQFRSTLFMLDHIGGHKSYKLDTEI